MKLDSIKWFDYGLLKINIMPQNRIKSGKDFEKSLETKDWKLKSKSPRINWGGNGRHNIDKLKNTPVSELTINVEKSKFIKYDLYNASTNKGREAKKYHKKKCTDWKLYSEPFFKIATKDQAKKITPVHYNGLIEKFYVHNTNNKLFHTVSNKIIETCEGIFVEDGFIPINEIEFRTIMLKGTWGGYHRITIQWRWVGNKS